MANRAEDWQVTGTRILPVVRWGSAFRVKRKSGVQTTFSNTDHIIQAKQDMSVGHQFANDFHVS